MTKLRALLLDLLYEQNARMDNGIESVVDDIIEIIADAGYRKVEDGW